MCTGAVYRLAAATHGIPVIGFVWIQPVAALDDDNPWFGDPELTGVGDDEFDVGDVVGDVLCMWKIMRLWKVQKYTHSPPTWF